jgi:hypothetical protein
LENGNGSQRRQQYEDNLVGKMIHNTTEKLVLIMQNAKEWKLVQTDKIKFSEIQNHSFTEFLNSNIMKFGIIKLIQLRAN